MGRLCQPVRLLLVFEQEKNALLQKQKLVEVGVMATIVVLVASSSKTMFAGK